jgi:hypothetical protein
LDVLGAAYLGQKNTTLVPITNKNNANKVQPKEKFRRNKSPHAKYEGLPFLKVQQKESPVQYTFGYTKGSPKFINPNKY